MSFYFVTALLAASFLSSITTGAVSASTEKVLYSFPSGAGATGSLAQDRKGALYGTAQALGGDGAIYRLKERHGAWRDKILFEFSGSDGVYPTAGPLLDDTTGVLLGTTTSGGTSADGTVYSLAPVGRGWSENVIHSFSYSDGAYPYAVLLKDRASGNLYGTTNSGGAYDCGTAFELTQLNGAWSFSTVYDFKGDADACSPWTQLKPGAKAGTLIGAAWHGAGQIFQLKEANGVWSDSIVYSFGGDTEVYPSDIDASSDGTIYGVTQLGGEYGEGVVFKLTPNRRKYAYSVIYNFGVGGDGAQPYGISFDAATGNLYGTTYYGGNTGEGTVFSLTPNGNSWTETVLHNFAGGVNDGGYPESRPIVDRSTGALYGTTSEGGVNNGGTVYEVQP